MPAADWYAALVDAPIRHLEAVLPEDDRPLLARLRRIVQPLENAGLPFVVEHGDLGHPNLIRLRTGKIGVVDWELAQVAGMIASDLFFFLSYAAFSLNRANETGVYLPVFEQTFFGKSAWAIPYMRTYLEQVALPAHLLGPLFALTWTRYLSKLLLRMSEGESDPMSAAVHTQMRSDRYHGLWRYTVTHIDDLVLV
jgi:thiamine kinase-like enzyme